MASSAVSGSDLPVKTVYGYWEEEDSGQCLYALDFRSDGSLTVVSGKEYLRGTFRLEEPKAGQPSDGVVHRRIEFDNEREDCGGDRSSQKGTSQSAFVHFDGTDVMLLCRDVQGERCFGRFLRKR